MNSGGDSGLAKNNIYQIDSNMLISKMKNQPNVPLVVVSLKGLFLAHYFTSFM